MENWFDLEKTIKIFNVMFDKVLYEVQIIERNIESVYRSDGREMSVKEFEGVRDFIYEDLLK
jgi:hypothetical protein